MPNDEGSLLELLSSEEIERARQFHFSYDRERFIHARGVLRTLLGRYVGTDPAGFRLTVSFVCEHLPPLRLRMFKWLPPRKSE